MLVALYPRVSTTEQAENGNSLQEQIDRMTKFSESFGWTIYKVYTDAGYSGSNTNRPGLQEMIRDVKAGRIDKVIVYKLDRLSRSQKDTLELIEDIFLANDTEFISMSESFDTSSPLGRAMIGILAVFAQLERDQIRERMKMGKEAIAKKGMFQGGRYIPIGYTYEDGEYVVEPFEAMQVKEIFRLASQGFTPYSIAKQLDEKGFRQKNGPWQDQTVRRVLEAKTYIGYKRYAGQWYKSTHEPIISEDLFYKVQAIRQASREEHMQYNRRAGKATTYLGGYLYCAHCGAKYSKTKTVRKDQNGNVVRVYEKFKCNSRLSKKRRLVKDPNCRNKHWDIDALTNAVFNEIRKLALDPAYLHTVEVKTAYTADLTAITDHIDKISSQLSRLMDLYSVGQMPLDILQERIRQLNDQKARLEAEADEIKKRSESKPSLDHVREALSSFSDILDRGDFEEIRSAIGALIRKIEIDNDDITIYWTFS